MPTARLAPVSLVEPLAPARYKVQFTASSELHEKLERLRGLMRSQVPSGDLAAIIDQAVTEKLERLEARRFAQTRKPRKSLRDSDTSPRSRYVPAAVRRAVSGRGGKQCQYRDDQGQQCPKRYEVEFHHMHPFGVGGDHSPSGMRLLCRAHNRLIAEHDYGRTAMARQRRPGRASEVSGETASEGSPAPLPFGP